MAVSPGRRPTQPWLTRSLSRGGNVELAEAARTIVTSLAVQPPGRSGRHRSGRPGQGGERLRVGRDRLGRGPRCRRHRRWIGEDIYSVAAGLALLANAGVRGTLAGTQLGRAYKELSVGLKQQRSGDELGVKVTNFQGNMCDGRGDGRHPRRDGRQEVEWVAG